jgi:xanthine dehydrogenase accessory factor
MLRDYLKAASLLREKGQSFVLATVVRAERPTSAKPGAKAIVTDDGTLVGWVGGSCAEPTVVREARKAIEDGEPRLVRLCPPEQLGRGPKEGVVEVALTCVSGGTLEIYLEPHLPKPRIVAVGHLPVAEALVSLGKDMGYDVTVMSPEADAKRFPRADRVLKHLDFSQLEIGRDTAIVVASHGNYDEEALEGALGTKAAYVSLVASSKRAESVLHDLRQVQVPEERLRQLKYPAGIDLGASTPEEIALSILAELVLIRRRELISGLGDETSARQVPEPSHRSRPIEATDPVCGMTVEAETARHSSEHAGQVYYFCCSGCKRSFDREPKTYAAKNMKK